MSNAHKPESLDFSRTLPPVNVRVGTKKPALLGIVAVLIAAGGFGVWATAVPLDSAIVAPGKVTVATKRKLVQHLEGGIIKSFSVKDGDRIKEGEVIVTFDDTRAKTRSLIARIAYLSQLAEEARLFAERDENLEVAFPNELMAEAAQDSEIGGFVSNQNRIFEARRHEYLGQTAILNSRIGRLEEEISGMRAEFSASERQLVVAREELKTLEEIFQRQLTTRNRVLERKREVYQLEGMLGKLTANMAAARKEINETQLNLLQLQKKTKTDVVTELRESQAKVLDLREEYLAAKTELQRTVVRAPASGTVFGSQIHTIGGVVRAGDTLLEIVPDHDKLVIEVKLRPQDVDDVSVGQPTEIRFSAFKQRLTPTVEGRVAFVSADTLYDPHNPEMYYVASIAIDGKELRKLGKVSLVPGMPAEAMIKTGQRTALAYLMQPLEESMNRAWREH
jgi:HlyD family type I secretion membrane fusion protein